MSVEAVVTEAVERPNQILTGPSMVTRGGGTLVHVLFTASSLITVRTVAVIGRKVVFARRPVLTIGIRVVHTVVLPQVAQVPFVVRWTVTRVSVELVMAGRSVMARSARALVSVSFTVQSNVTRLTDTGKTVVAIHTCTPVLTR